MAHDLIRGNAYEGETKVIDVSGDGPQMGGRPVEATRDEAVLAGVTVNALVVKSAGGGYPGPGGIPLQVHYERDVIGGFGAFVMTAESRAEFGEAILAKLLKEIAGGGRARIVGDRRGSRV